MNILVRGYLNSDPRSGPYWTEYHAIYAPVRYLTSPVSGGVSIDGLNGKLTGDVELPSMIVGQPVVSIGNEAFSHQSKLNIIIIPNSVTTIGSEAFHNCSALTNIALSSNITSVGTDAFAGCNNLSITWDYNSVLSSYNFNDYLTSVTIGNNISSIPDNAFKECSKLTCYIIPNSVTTIGSSSFENCSTLTNIALSSNITSVGTDAFFGCSNLAITWNYNPVLRSYNFKDYLTSVTIGNNVTSIPDYAFRNCSNLASITIPNSIISIGSEAFRDCSSLTEVFLPDGLTSINDTTFWGCSSLSNITIPDDVTYIGLGAFSGCSSLLSIIIPDGVTEINIETFSYCTNLISITIGSSVESIGFDAFRYCINLDTIYIEREYPNITLLGYEAFYGCDPYINIYVPYNSLIYYKGASDWSDYSSRIMTINPIPECGFENNYDYTMSYTNDTENYYLFIIWVVDEGDYRISFNSTSAFQIEFYDKDAVLLDATLVTVPNNQDEYIYYFDCEIELSAYMYYLVVKFTDPLAIGTIETTVACFD
jgi:pterin-4a-carbinolamine dehydratase